MLQGYLEMSIITWWPLTTCISGPQRIDNKNLSVIRLRLYALVSRLMEVDMGTKQWGHGYHMGIKEALKNNTGLVGLWVHILKNGTIENQLKVIKGLPDDYFLLQYYSFLDGTPTKNKVFTLDEMKDFNFYPDDKSMRQAYDKESTMSC